MGTHEEAVDDWTELVADDLLAITEAIPDLALYVSRYATPDEERQYGWFERALQNKQMDHRDRAITKTLMLSVALAVFERHVELELGREEHGDRFTTIPNAPGAAGDYVESIYARPETTGREKR